MRFGEFQDLLACDAIYNGIAIEKEQKMTQEEMWDID